VCRYVSGRVRAPGEINGKSGNLNNCLRNVIYADMLPTKVPTTPNINKTISTEEALCISRAAPAVTPVKPVIPVQEVVVVFDADMCSKPNFFRHVSWPQAVTCHVMQAAVQCNSMPHARYLSAGGTAVVRVFC
jgi:hypothetical protein